jgi:anti-sigma factor RsiW
MTTCERHEASLGLYVEGDLPPRDRARVERHLETCPRCRAFLRELEASQGALRSLAAEPLPEGALEAVRARVLAEAIRTRPGAPPVPTWAWASAAAVIAALAVALGVTWTRQPSGRHQAVADLQDSPPPRVRPAPPATAPGAAVSASGETAAPVPPAAPASSPMPGRTRLPPGDTLAAVRAAIAPPRAASPPPTGGGARSGEGSAVRGPTETPPTSTLQLARRVYGSEGSATSERDSALTPEEADQLARAVVAMSRIERLSDVPAASEASTSAPAATDESAGEAPRGSTGPAGSFVRWTTADPDVVIYWQLDSNGGDS